MKKIIIIVIVLSAFVSNAQRTMFGAQNKHLAPTTVAPTVIESLINEGLVLNLDAGDVSSKIANTKIYKGKGLTSAQVNSQFNLVKSRYGL